MLKVMVPATSANLGPGFDFLGLALDLYNTVSFTPASEWSVRAEGYGAEALTGRDDLLVCQALRRVFSAVGEELNGGIVHLENRIPEAGGLGTSATAIVGGLAVANRYLGDPLTKDDLLTLAAELEGHPDNVAPAIFGGLVGVVKEKAATEFRSTYTCLKIPFPSALQVVIVVPKLRVSTAEARRLLPQQVSLEEATFNLARTGLLVGACFSGRVDLFRLAMEDVLHQNRRAVLIPGFNQVLAKAYQEGAFGVALSGSGPTIIAFVPGTKEETVGEGMVSVFTQQGIEARWLSAAVNQDGFCFVED
ncbi:MAG TPA: homoserine kinase [Firmicutes bacterium]|jgi:homoserine kinase|nr:homoserine kinase [Bacillota bacterium]